MINLKEPVQTSLLRKYGGHLPDCSFVRYPIPENTSCTCGFTDALDKLETAMTFDPTKPVQTRCGYPARVLATDAKGSYPVLALYEATTGRERVVSLNADGTHPCIPDYSLVNVPPPEPLMVTIRMTPEDAAVAASQSSCFRFVSGWGESREWNYLAHFTALAEQQRGEG